MRNRVFGPAKLSNNAVGTVEFQNAEPPASILLALPALLQEMSERMRRIVVFQSASIIQMSRTN